MDISRLILLFFVYAFLGWCCEVAFAAVKTGRFINRGFLNGPVCPIYGFGVLGVALAMRPVQHNLAALYLGSAALTTAIEFLTGWTLERLFHAKWWDYTGMPLNIMGYVCLPFSLLWGVACLVIVRWVHPMFAAFAAGLPFQMCVALDCLYGGVFAFDLCATVAAVRRLSDRLSRMTEAAAELHAISDEIGQTIFDTTQLMLDGAEAVQTRSEQARARLTAGQGRVAAWLDQRRDQVSAAALRERLEAAGRRSLRALQERGFGHRRLLDAFPHLRSHRHQEALDTLRAFYKKLVR